MLSGEVLPLSAITKSGIDRLESAILKVVSESRSEVEEQEQALEEEGVVYNFEEKEDENAFTICKENEGWRVSGEKVERAVYQTDWDNIEAVDYFQSRLKAFGVEDALFSAGAKNGDEIFICDFSFNLYSSLEVNTVNVGIFGGSFDPVHKGHIACANAALDFANLDEVYFVPTNISPFKIDRGEALFSAFDRLEMLDIATKSNERFRVSDFEIENEGISYTCETLAHFKKMYEQRGVRAKFFIILGSDLLEELPLWKNAGRIARDSHILCVTRPGVAIKEIPSEVKDAGFKVSFISAKSYDVSSTEIKEMLEAGECDPTYFPDGVFEYIKNKGFLNG